LESLCSRFFVPGTGGHAIVFLVLTVVVPVFGVVPMVVVALVVTLVASLLVVVAATFSFTTLLSLRLLFGLHGFSDLFERVFARDLDTFEHFSLLRFDAVFAFLSVLEKFCET